MACRDDDDSSGGRGKRKCADFVGDGIAGHLLKWVHFQQDTEGRDVGLFYFRDTDGREVDFILAEKGKPITAIECKWSDSKPDKNLRYWKIRFPDCAAWQLSATGAQDFVTPEGIRVRHAMDSAG